MKDNHVLIDVHVYCIKCVDDAPCSFTWFITPRGSENLHKEIKAVGWKFTPEGGICPFCNEQEKS